MMHIPLIFFKNGEVKSTCLIRVFQSLSQHSHIHYVFIINLEPADV